MGRTLVLEHLLTRAQPLPQTAALLQALPGRVLLALVNDMAEFFPRSQTLEPDLDEYLRPERVTRCLLLVNLTEAAEQPRIVTASAIYSTNWGEIFTETFDNPPPALTKSPSLFLRGALAKHMGVAPEDLSSREVRAEGRAERIAFGPEYDRQPIYAIDWTEGYDPPDNPTGALGELLRIAASFSTSPRQAPALPLDALHLLLPFVDQVRDTAPTHHVASYRFVWRTDVPHLNHGLHRPALLQALKRTG